MKNTKEKIGELLAGEKFSATTMSVLLIAVVLVANTVLYTVFSLLGWQISPATLEDFSLSGHFDDTMETVGKAGRKVTITFCYPSESEVRDHGTGGYVYRTAKEFEKRYPDAIEIKYVNIMTGVDSNGDPVDLSKFTKDENGNEVPIFKTSVIFEYGGNYKVLTDTTTSAGYSNFYVLDYSASQTSVIAYNGEEVMTSAISWVLADEHKTAFFTTGHSEVIDPAFVDMISMAGYNISTIDLKTADFDELNEADLIIISNPRTDFEASDEDTTARSETDRLEYYLEKGGNLFVMLNSLAKELPVLEGVLAERGIALSYAEDSDGNRALNIVRDLSESIVTSGYTIAAGFADNGYAIDIGGRVDKYSGGRVIIGDVTALELSGDAKPILLASPTAELYAHGAATNSDGGYAVAAYTTVTGLDGKIGSIFVMPSSQMATTAALIANGYANKDFAYSVFEQLYGCELLPYGTSIISFRDTALEGLTMGTARIYMAALMALPACAAVVGAVILTRRKNR